MLWMKKDFFLLNYFSQYYSILPNKKEDIIVKYDVMNYDIYQAQNILKKERDYLWKFTEYLSLLSS